MNVLELLRLDMGKPIYLKQNGSAYIIKTLENESGDNYKLTLVQI
jgi:hypothetical protein